MADPADHLVSIIRQQAAGCGRAGSAMYEQLVGAVADDVEAGGVFRRVLAGHESDSGPSGLALRLVAALHWLVLGGDAEELEPFYPSVGGRFDLAAAWPVVCRVADRSSDLIVRRLEQPPQTNEIGRGAALAGGLRCLRAGAADPIRLFEIGASAGLNLRADRFAISDAAGRWSGPTDSPVRLEQAWRGSAVEATGPLEVVERGGCDLAPIDATTPSGERVLTSYVWPDQAGRLDRLRGAIEVARSVPAAVEPLDARTFVGRLDLADDTTTVLWHSVMWQYLTPVDRQAITATLAALGAAASERRRLAHLFLEPVRRAPGRDHETLVVLTEWPGGTARIVGAAPAHGVPVTWETDVEEEKR